MPDKPTIEQLEQQAREFAQALGFNPNCPHCQTEIKLEEGFCKSCGFVLDEENS